MNPKQPLKIVTYLRVSTTDQDVAAQRLELTDYCRRQGWETLAEFSDVLSGSKASRPGLDSLKARCAAGGVDAVAVVKLDRMGRSLLNVVTLIGQLEAMGVAVICTSQGIDTRAANPCGKMQYQIIAAVAEFERNLIRERTVAGLRAAKAAGKKLGKPSVALAGKSEGDLALAVNGWEQAGQPGGVRGLAKSLGGCSPTTAWKIYNASRIAAPEPIA